MSSLNRFVNPFCSTSSFFHVRRSASTSSSSSSWYRRHSKYRNYPRYDDDGIGFGLGVGNRMVSCTTTFGRHNKNQRLLSTFRVRNMIHSSNYLMNSPRKLQLHSSMSSSIPEPSNGYYMPPNDNDDNHHGTEQYHSTASVVLDGLNPSQVDAVTQPVSTITRVVAGPGSGKTRVLTCRVAYLLQEDRRNKILAVTFTRRAAGEMQQRVESLLEQQQSIEDALNNNLSTKSPIPQHTNHIDDDTVIDDSPPPAGLERVTLGTFHSVCAKILRYNGDCIPELPSVIRDGPIVGGSGNNVVNLDGNFVILDQSDQLRLVRECLKEAEIDLASSKPPVKPLQLLNVIGTLKETFAQGDDPFETTNTDGKKEHVPGPLRIAKKIYHQYRHKLFTNNALDFDDLIYMTKELLETHPDIQQRLHRRWPHLLVDEFQDTSRTQLDLVKLLTSTSLFVVGDADQSIYSWRGANAGSLTDFVEEFNGYMDHTVETVYLKENYRSTSNIVKAAEKVISMTENSGKDNDDIRKAMKPKRGSGPPPRIVSCQDERGEAKFVVDTIIEKRDKGDLVPGQTIAIVYRTNAQSRYLEEACVEKNLPYVIRGGAGGFYKRAEVKDCLCFLRWLHNGNDEGAMLRAFKTPSKGIGEVALREFQTYCQEVANYYRLTSSNEKIPTPLDVLLSMRGDGSDTTLKHGAPVASVFISKRALKKFVEFSQKMRFIRNAAETETLDMLILTIIEELEMMAHFDSISKSQPELEERLANVKELRQAAKRYSGSGAALSRPVPEKDDNEAEKEDDKEDDEGTFEQETALGNFLDDVALVTDTPSESENDANNKLVANLMTIHASKGTEFDVVFVVGNEEGTLPSGLAIQEGEDSVQLGEEKRLCYVAMTRAKTELIMTWRKEVTSFSSMSDASSRKIKKRRSRFLDALVAKKKSTNGTTSPKTDSNGKSSSSNGRSNVKKNDDGNDYNNLGQKRAYSTTAPPRSRPSARVNSTPGGRPRTPSTQQEYRQPQRTTSSNGSSSSSNAYAGRQVPTTSQSNSWEPNDDRQNNSMGRSRQTTTDGNTPRIPPPTSGEEDTRRNGREMYPPSRGREMSSQGMDYESSNTIRKKNGSSSSSNQKKKTTSEKLKVSSERKNFDSTWFFPVGSSVIHKNFGKGEVLNPPTDDKQLVCVQFDNGRTMEFTLQEQNLYPDLS